MHCLSVCPSNTPGLRTHKRKAPENWIFGTRNRNSICSILGQQVKGQGHETSRNSDPKRA